MAARKTTDAVIYCGPGIANVPLRTFDVFRGIPGNVSQEIEKCPAIALLLVPVPELQQTRNALSVKGSAANIAYQEILRYKEGR